MLTQYKDIFDNIKKNVLSINEFPVELELDLNKNKTFAINYEKYIMLLKYFNVISKKNNYTINKTTILDISYSQINNEIRTNYRISLPSSEINKYISQINNNNNIIYEILLKQLDKNKSISIIKKVQHLKKSNTDIFDIDDLNIRARISKEQIPTKNEIKQLINIFEESRKTRNNELNNNINFRLKQRLSIVMFTSNLYDIVVDLTNAKSSKNINNLINQSKHNSNNDYTLTYELEIEALIKQQIKKQNIDDIINIILTNTEIFIKLLQGSNFILTESEKQSVFSNYNLLLNHQETPTSIDSKNVISLEIQYLDLLVNKYAITDKADGEHSFIFITNDKAYIITQNMHVRYTGIETNKKYNDTILDGELIFLPKFNKYIFMGFDCLFYRGKDIRKNILLIERLKYIEKAVRKCFIFKEHKFKAIKNNPENINLETNEEFYNRELKNYFDILMNDIKVKNNFPLIRPKYFIPTFGLHDSEIFLYSKIFWNYYANSSNYPYRLDGLVYQPLQHPYETIKKNIKLNDYKWKPEENNSIDFYIEFARDENDKIYILYDNVLNKIDEENTGIENTENLENPEIDNKIENELIYKICYLHVGKSIDKKETPVIFNPEYNNPNHDIHVVYLPIDKNNNVRDVENNIIQDKTVVEFYYDNNLKTLDKFRWKPLRTRHDKTESIIKYKRKYGNNEQIAYKIWNSIKYPILFKDIEILADQNQYILHRNKMVESVDIELFEKSKSALYYNVNAVIDKHIKPQLDFHNMIKTILINNYIKPSTIDNRKKTIFDVGCGKGGDTNKFYNAHAQLVVGIDPDWGGLHTSDGAISRYRTLKNTKPKVPLMEFINGNFNVPLNIEQQIKVVTDKTQSNINLMEKYFNKKFDVLNIQFSFHYFLQNEETWINACNNINQMLNDDGYVIITCFDAKLVNDVLEKNNGQYTQHLTIDGDQIVFHDIIRKYTPLSNKESYKYGNAIDVHIRRFMDAGKYVPEYLVDKRFIIPEFKKRCNLALVETDLFGNIYDNIDGYISNITDIETKANMKTFLLKLKRYYEKTSTNEECLKITRLNRFYIFKKMKK